MSKESRDAELGRHWYAGLNTENKIIANILLRLAKEVDDGIFYKKRKNRLYMHAAQQDDANVAQHTQFYVPWWGVGKGSEMFADEFDKKFNINNKLRTELQKIEEFRMKPESKGGMKLPKLKGGPISEIMPKNYEAIDFTEDEIKRITGARRYAPMDSVSQIPFQPIQELQNDLLGGLAAGRPGLKLEAPGGSGKSTLFMYFGRAAAQHSLSHRELWWNDEKFGAFSYANVIKTPQYWEKRFIKFEMNRVYTNFKGVVGGGQEDMAKFRAIATDSRYKDLFVFILEEFSSGLGLAAKPSDSGQADQVRTDDHSPLGMYNANFKTMMDPGNSVPISKYIAIYAPEDRANVEKYVFSSGQQSSRYEAVRFPKMDRDDIRGMLEDSLFSTYYWKGIFEDKLSMHVNWADEDFDEMYPSEVIHQMTDALLDKFEIFVANANKEKPGEGDKIAPPRALNYILEKAKRRAMARKDIASQLISTQKEYKDLQDSIDIKKSQIRELQEDSKRLGVKASLKKVGMDKEDGTSPLNALAPDPLAPINPKDLKPTVKPKTSDDPSARSVENINKQIQELENEIRTQSEKLALVYREKSALGKRLKSMTPGATFSQSFRDAAFIKPIDIQSIPDNELSYMEMQSSEQQVGTAQDARKTPQIDPETKKKMKEQMRQRTRDNRELIR